MRFTFISEIKSGQLHYDGIEIINAKWFTLDEVMRINDSELRDGRFTKKMIEDVRIRRHFPIECIFEGKAAWEEIK